MLEFKDNGGDVMEYFECLIYVHFGRCSNNFKKKSKKIQKVP